MKEELNKLIEETKRALEKHEYYHVRAFWREKCQALLKALIDQLAESTDLKSV